MQHDRRSENNGMKVLKIWDNRAAHFRSYAEEAFFQQGGRMSLIDRVYYEEKERHMDACCRFTELCAEELRKELEASVSGFCPERQRKDMTPPISEKSAP